MKNFVESREYVFIAKRVVSRLGKEHKPWSNDINGIRFIAQESKIHEIVGRQRYIVNRKDCREVLK